MSWMIGLGNVKKIGKGDIKRIPSKDERVGRCCRMTGCE
jgi:hypothetical protein